jgi:F-type H+-transporting ATPase subunit delta
MIVKKYAQLLFEQSQDEKTLNEVTFVMRGILDDSAVYKYFLSQADKNEKERILSDTMNKCGISKVSSRFITLVMRHKRIKELPQILEAYSKLRANARGERIAEVVSADAIGNDDMATLTTFLESIFKAKIILQHAVDPSIIGGIIVKCDSMFLDASIKGVIERISAR